MLMSLAVTYREVHIREVPAKLATIPDDRRRKNSPTHEGWEEQRKPIGEGSDANEHGS